MANRSDLPPWLRHGARPSGGLATRRRAAGAVAFALVVFVAGGLTGYLVAGRQAQTAAPPPPPPACPAPVACAPAPTPAPARHHAAAPAGKRSKPVAKTLAPLPDSKPMDEGARTQALRAFAEKRAPELRDCLAEPDRGPPMKLGAAFEIGSDGAVDFVQILGADGSPKDVKRCYSKQLKRWRFPEELLRGEEKLLVNFVL
jgi:hypothetical protein